MPESAEEIHARVVAAAGPDGRLPVPPIAEWDTCPWEGEVRVRPVLPPADEPPREGVDGVDCATCAHPDRHVIWGDERWTVSSTAAPTGMPLVLFLRPREHFDFTDMDDEQAAECGRITVWLTRIIEGMPHVGRCHVFKVGDGAEHLHLWFFARPDRMPQFRGSFAIEWDDILPPVPEDVWRADLAYVAEHLASHGGAARR
jgi:diadenosine tetraphosphate (Ap4A) HIT family hydrolase